MLDAAQTDGLIAVVKRDCPTCALVASVLADVRRAGARLVVLSQDDPTFPDGLDALDDRELAHSYRLAIDTVPTLLRFEDSQEMGRAVGWSRDDWRTLTGIDGLGEDLPPQRPGCGSRSLEPGIVERLEAAHGDMLRARRIDLGDDEDPIEAMFARGWSDGLPIVPPTPERVIRMLAGTDRDPHEVVATLPPNLAPCTVEKVAISAVMAGGKPEYLPVVLAAVEASCAPAFGLHGLIATTMPHGPMIIVNGPIARRLGIASGGNALGQGHRANSTIGRALQLLIRNVGGGRPGEVDRACLGQPGKVGFCFAENEATSPWTPLHVERGFDAEASTVTLFGGEGPRVVVDQLSRTPESLTTSLAACLRTICHPKLPFVFDAILVVSPEHARVFREAKWDKEQLRNELIGRLMIPADELKRGAGNMAEGVPDAMLFPIMPKLRPEGLLIVHAGGDAGLFSAIIGGWVNGEKGTDPVTVEIRT